MPRIDPHLPLELDDGTPVEYFETRHGFHNVRVPKSPTRPGKESPDYWSRPGLFAYDVNTGVFGSGTKTNQYVLRNVANDPAEMEYDV